MEEQIGALMQSAPQVVKRVLRGLSGRELKRVARVCRMWRTYSAIVIKERRRILSITMAKRNSQSHQKQPIVEDRDEYKQFLLDLDMECGLAIVFRAVKHRATAVSPMDFIALRCSLTPSTVVFGATCSSGIVGTSMDGSIRERQEPEKDCLSAFLMPKSLPDGVVIKHFAFPLADMKRLETAVQDTVTFAQTFGWPESETVKCMILVSSKSVPSGLYDKLISCIRTVHDGKLALAGGIADRVHSTDNDEQQNSAIVGLLFGGENVRAASLVIGEGDNTKDDVKKRLMELKATVATWGECKQKLGFMFACCGRGQELHHGATDVETGIFKELMSDIPLNGMFSLGEFGWDFLTPSPLEQPAKKKRKQDDILLGYTTTIAVVGFV